MDIYILRDGQETGPFSLKTMQTLLQRGDVAAGDLAWHAGLPKWLPVSELLNASASVPVEPPPAKAEPATAKQKALLSFLGIAFPADLSKDQAAFTMNDALENPQHAERLAHWNEERLRLHPDLFGVEIQARKDNRANQFFELCQTRGADYFTGVTAAHCQVLVGFLDVKFPNWDARQAEAPDHFFFPAVAEKFPQLVQKQWRGRLQYIDGQKVAPEITRRSATSKLSRPSASPLAAILRGVVLGGMILGALYFAFYNKRDSASPAPEPEKITQPVPQPAVAKIAEPHATIPVEAGTISPAPSPPVAVTAPAAPAPENAAPLVPPSATATPAEPLMNTGMMAANPAPAPLSPMVIPASTLATAPMASLPGTEPPLAPAPPPTSAAEPLPTPATPTVETPPTPTSRTQLLLTKPVEVELAYGKLTLPAGTAVKLVGRQGTQVRVSYQNSILTIPAASTDLE